jgi:hypothetical protein
VRLCGENFILSMSRRKNDSKTHSDH